jgi:HEAT repeat protein
LIELLPDSTIYESGIQYFRAVNDEASRALVAIGRESASRLALEYGDLPAESRRSAAFIARQSGPVGRELLTKLVNDYSSAAEDERTSLLAAIAACDPVGETALPLLISGLSDPDGYTRASAARWLQRSTLLEPIWWEEPGPAERWFVASTSDMRPVVEALAKALHDRVPLVRGMAAAALGTYPEAADRAIPELLPLLTDNADYSVMYSNHSGGLRTVAEDAIEALSRFRDRADAIAPRLLALASTADPPDEFHPEKFAAERALAELAPHCTTLLPQLIETLSGPRPRSVLRSLTRLGPVATDAQPILRKLLKSDDDYLKLCVAITLTSIDPVKNADAIELVADALTDEDSRRDACDFLEIAGPHAAPLTSALVRHLPHRTLDGWLDLYVPDALQAIGPAAIEASPILIDHLDTEPEFGNDAPTTLYALGPLVVPQLSAALADESRSPRHNLLVVGVMGRFGRDAATAVPTIIPHMTSKYPRVREAAARALGAIGSHPELSLPALGQAIGDPRPFVRAAAAEGLAAFPDHAAETVPQLVSALGDEYLDVRVAAVTALGRIGQRANSALPALTALKQDPNVLLSESAAEAIDRILRP